MPQPTKQSSREFRMRTLAGMTNADIVARSLVSGTLFVLLLLGLDWFQSQATDLQETFFLGMIFAVTLGVFDLFLRLNARKKLG